MGLFDGILGAIGSGITGILGASAASGQAKAATDSTAQANQLLSNIFNQNRTDTAPWRNAGGAAINQLAYSLGLGTPPASYYLPATSTNGSVVKTADLPGILTNVFSSDGGISVPVNMLSPYAEDDASYGRYPRNTNVGLNYLDTKLGPTFANQAYNNYLHGDQFATPSSQADNFSGNNFQYMTRPPNQTFGPSDYMSVAQTNTVAPGATYGVPSTAGAFPGSGTFGDLNHDFGLSDFQADPGYAFRLSEGQKALERSAASRGLSLSGAQLKGLDRYNQDFASNEFTNAYNRFENNRAGKFNRLATVAGLGQVSANQLANQGTQIAGQQGNNLIAGMTGAANARASGYGQIANSINGALNNLPPLFNPVIKN
jgi:hypothetical protein